MIIRLSALFVILTIFILACGPLSSITVGCLDAEDIVNIRAQLVEGDIDERMDIVDKYVGETVCVEGKIRTSSVSASRVTVAARAEKALFVVLHFKYDDPTTSYEKEESKQAEELESWLGSRGEGDTIRAKCVVDGIAGPWSQTQEAGTLLFENCTLKK